MRQAFGRLRWQLTFSHLLATAVTLLFMIAVLSFIISYAIASSSRSEDEPARDARLIAQSVSGLVRQGNLADLNTVLRLMADGTLQAPAGDGHFGAGGPPWMETIQPLVRDVAYVVVTAPDGSVLASSDPAGASFAPPDRAAWQPLAERALSGERDLNRLVVRGSAGGLAAFGAYPILSEGDQVIATALVGKTVLPIRDRALSYWRALGIFAVASVAILTVSSVFALVSCAVVAYWLSKKLVRRLERLGSAAESLAAGDLSVRVEEGQANEVGMLNRRFNQMAADLERTLNDLQAERDRVAGLLHARRELVAGVSHELRTPVATVRGYIESALRRRDTTPPDLAADLETMEREITRLQRLIEDLFTLSRAEVGRIELRPESIDAGAAVRRLAETMAPLAWGQRRVQIVSDIAPNLPPAHADAQRLEQIVSNLLGNAVRHTPPGGLVAVAADAEPKAVKIEVRDTGEGIAPDDLPRIFERFYRGQNQDGRGGAGLGLALAKEMAEAMGGSVEAASTQGEGSCFTVRLPRA